MKVVINAKHGGFGLSNEAIKLYAKKEGIPLYGYVEDFEAEYKPSGERPLLREGIDKKKDWLVYWVMNDLGDSPTHEELNNADEFDKPESRSDPVLISIIEELGKRADGDHAKLKIVEIPDDVDYVIEEYDGMEWISEAHRTWR